jgi:putative FmdB family regulatory protein
MPLYEFRCPEGHDFEKFYRSISAAPPSENCPLCGKAAERLMSAAGLVFKGSGFYITDYGKDGKKAEREAATAAAKSADTKAESKTEAKTESKTESTTESAKAEAPSPAPKTEAKPAVTKAAPSSTKKAE